MPNRWLSPRALVLHVAVVLVATACLIAGWWQVGRARSGNWLSYAYAVEWPAFAVLAVVGWWQLLHNEMSADTPAEDATAAADFGARLRRRAVEQETPELREYNDYLQARATSTKPKTWRNPRGV